MSDVTIDRHPRRTILAAASAATLAGAAGLLAPQQAQAANFVYASWVHGYAVTALEPTVERDRANVGTYGKGYTLPKRTQRYNFYVTPSVPVILAPHGRLRLLAVGFDWWAMDGLVIETVEVIDSANKACSFSPNLSFEGAPYRPFYQYLAVPDAPWVLKGLTIVFGVRAIRDGQVKFWSVGVDLGV
jgi:hypothetical protein